MEQTFARGRLVEPKTLRALMQRSDVKGGLQMASHLGAILLTGMLLVATWGSWWAVPVFMVHGVLINFLYAAQHELSHSTVFATKKLNEIFGRIIGFVMIYPRDFDQIQHFAHHQFTQNWDRDGELAREPYTLTSYLLWFWGPSYWYSRIARIFRLSSGVVIEPYLHEREKPKVIREARWHLAGYLLIAAVSIALQSWWAVILWFAPMVCMKFVHQLQNTIEHLGLSHEDDILENTRSTDTNALMRWICWNMQHHTAHHSFPSVPFHRLAELDAAIEKGAGRPAHRMGYIEFQIEILKALSGGKSEADYPHDEVWIRTRADGSRQRVAIS